MCGSPQKKKISGEPLENTDTAGRKTFFRPLFPAPALNLPFPYLDF